MNSWKWSTGEAYYKSARIEPQKEKKEPQVSYDSGENAIRQSLADESHGFGDELFSTDNDLISITNSMFSRSQNDSGTRREELDNKMADRGLVFQRGVNPYLNQTSYVNDVVVRDMFLKPLNTTQDRIKNEENESAH
jgi:hypothetical protein